MAFTTKGCSCYFNCGVYRQLVIWPLSLVFRAEEKRSNYNLLIKAKSNATLHQYINANLILIYHHRFTIDPFLNYTPNVGHQSNIGGVVQKGHLSRSEIL